MADHELFPSMHELDRDGALAEAAAGVDGITRTALLRRAAAVAGGAVALPAFLGSVPTAIGATSSGDVAILNFALTLEYLEAAFYKEAVSKGALSGETKKFASVVAAHEAAHVQALKTALGSKATKKPSFDFKGTTASQATFQTTAQTLEDTGVKAYLGQAGNIKSTAVLKSALSILPVEAWHASWIADIIGKGQNPSPAPESFQSAATMQEILTAVKGTGFITTTTPAPSGSPVGAQPTLTG